MRCVPWTTLPEWLTSAYTTHGGALWELVEDRHPKRRLGERAVTDMTGLPPRKALWLRTFVEANGPPRIVFSDREDNPLVIWNQQGSGERADWREHRSDAVRRLLRDPSRFSNPEPPPPCSRPQWTSPAPAPVKRTGALHLVIGDAHSRPGEDRWRFAALGRMIRSIQPDRVISIGDWWDMPSLARPVRGTAAAEGGRVLADLQAGTDAFHTLLDAAAGAFYTGHHCRGNHDNWPEREQSNNPHMLGLFDRTDHAMSDAGWEVVPFLEPREIDGLRYVHFLENAMGRAFGAKYLAAQIIRERHASYVVGHAHRFDFRREPGPGGWITGLAVGIFSDGRASFAGQNNDTKWNRQICVLHDVADGDYDLETYSLERIKRLWG